MNSPYEDDLVIAEPDFPHEADMAMALLALVPDDPDALAYFCERFARDGWGEPTLTPGPAAAARLRAAQALVRLALEPIRTGRDDLWVKIEHALRTFEDERVGLMTMRARVVQILAERVPRLRARLCDDQAADAAVDLMADVDAAREIDDTIQALTLVHWRFGNVEHELLEELLAGRQEAFGLAATLSVRVGAFGDTDEAHAMDAYRKAVDATRRAERGGGPRPGLGRRPAK